MTSKADIQNLFNDWNRALGTRDTKAVLSLYAENAILLPTLSPVVRRNHEEIGEYFDFFLQFSPQSRIQEEHIRIHDDVAINSGIYVFTLTQDGMLKELPVRFTFVYKKIKDRWLIVEHHSSVLPQNPQ